MGYFTGIQGNVDKLREIITVSEIHDFQHVKYKVK